MDEKTAKKLRDKWQDYRRFSFIFLTLSAFLYIGCLLPDTTESGARNVPVLAAIVSACVLLSVVFHFVGAKAKHILIKHEML
ncbi:YrhC family protein [Shouchella shacheensis]|uniref:YrhC family protein n=1 Tax=Shouchella shacheensis TaxID=1649580 RepID=UPI00074005A0|nr:YrhC family protein [Shouchella shacheensis]